MYTHTLDTIIALHTAPITAVPVHVGAAPAPVTYTQILAHEWIAARALTNSTLGR
jgi:hypothetical protein